jgi:hypothetical protein
MTAFFFPPPFTGEGDRVAVEGVSLSSQIEPPPPSSLRADTSPVNGGGKGGALPAQVPHG